MQKLLSNMELSYNELTFFTVARTTLQSITESHSYIDSIYFYLDGYDLYFSSNAGLSPFDEVHDTDWLPAYLDMPSSQTSHVISRQIGKSPYTTQDTRVITVFERMTMAKGVIIVNIDTQVLSETLSTIAGETGIQLYLFNTSGAFLASGGTSSDISEKQADNIFSLMQVQQQDTPVLRKWIATDKGICLGNMIQDSDGYMYLAAITPLPSVLHMMQPYMLFFLLILAVNLFVTFILSYLTTRRNFNQISYIIQTFSDAEKGIPPVKQDTDANDEYDVILDNIISLFLRNTVLRTQIAEQKYKRQVNELIALQLQINPHFLFNTLQAISFKSAQITHGSTVVNAMIENLSDILKYSLASRELLVPVQDEIACLKKYVKIQQFRFGNRFYTYYEVDEHSLSFRLPRLLLQPLVENSISHGIRPSTESVKYIRVRIYEKNDRLSITVTDTGSGMDQERIRQVYKQINDENSRNIGLTNVNRRLLLYYGQEAGLKIRSKKGVGTSISFTIPAEKEGMREIPFE